MHHPSRLWRRTRMWRRLKVTGYRGLEILGPGAVAHMSLHHNLTMSKSHPTCRSGQRRLPRFTPGDRLSVYVGDQRGGRLGNRQRRVGEGAYMGGLGFGQALFAILFQESSKTPDFCGFWHSPYRYQMVISRAISRVLAAGSSLEQRFTPLSFLIPSARIPNIVAEF